MFNFNSSLGNYRRSGGDVFLGPPLDLDPTNGDSAKYGNALERIDENPEIQFLGPPNSIKNTEYYKKNMITRPTLPH